MSATCLIARETFVREYKRQSVAKGGDAEVIDRYLHATPCPCDYEGCHGWAMVPLDEETHNGLPAEAPPRFELYDACDGTRWRVAGRTQHA